MGIAIDVKNYLFLKPYFSAFQGGFLGVSTALSEIGT